MTDAEPPANGVHQISLFNRRAIFGKARPEDLEEQAPVFAGRFFTAKFDSDRSFSVHLEDYPIPELAAEAARILWTECRECGCIKSPGAVQDIVQALRRFGEFVIDTGRAATLRRLNDIKTADFNAFDTYLRNKHGIDHPLPYRRTTNLRRFLRIASDHGAIAEELLPRLSNSTSHGKRARPRDSYSPLVAKQIRDACDKDIDAVVDRITVKGEQLLKDGRDPLRFGWRSVENILWQIANRELITPFDPATPSQYYIQDFLVNNTEYNFLDLIGLIHLRTDDIFPLVVSLSLESGLPIESVKELQVDCLKNESRGYVDLEYPKRRADGTGNKIKRVKIGGRNTPGSIIKLILRLTRRSRECARPEDKKWLLLGYIHNRPVHHVCRITNFTFVNRSFCDRHMIFIDRDRPLDHITISRLRKTYKAERYARSNGHLADAADDHSATVHANHYAKIPSLLPLHEQAIAAGLRQALDAAYVPIIVTADTECRLQTNLVAVAKEIGLTTDQAEVVASGAKDVWLASCLDHDHSPHNGDDTCVTPVWGCLECRNAVITSSKLPAILAFLNHILGRRQQMNLKAWWERYGRAHDRITKHILPRFPAKEVAIAKAIAEAETYLVWLPAELTLSS